MTLVMKFLKEKTEAPTGEKLEPVCTHIRNMIIVSEMSGSITELYNEKTLK